MSMLDISGLQLTNLTAYNEYITDVIIAVIVYLSAFSLVIKALISGRKKKNAPVAPDSKQTNLPPVDSGPAVEPEKGGDEA